MSSLEEKKFLQLIKFSFDLSVKVTRIFTETNVLHAYNNSFVDFLNANKHDIYHLWNNNTRCCVCTSNVSLKQNRDLNKYQFTKLFDIKGNAVPGHFRKGQGKSIVQYCFCGISCLASCSLDDLDVILIHTLLRNFVKLNPDDEMWLDTVREIRNDLAHAVSTTCFDKGRLEKWWSKLEGSVLGLASKIRPKFYADSVKDQIKLLGIADVNINDGEIKHLFKTENKKLYDEIIIEHEKKFKQLMDKQDICAKETKDKSETDKQEIIKHIKQTTDDLSIEIKSLKFQCKLHDVETEVKHETTETTPYKTEAKQTIIKQEPSENPSSEDQNVQSEQTITKCKQEPSQNPSPESRKEQYSDRIQVEWRFKTPDTWRVEQMKQTLETVSGMIQSWSGFHIEFIYIGSLVIHTSVPRHVLRDRHILKSAFQSFLEKIVEVCEINTDVAETVNVDFRVLDVISSTDDLSIEIRKLTFPVKLHGMVTELKSETTKTNIYKTEDSDKCQVEWILRIPDIWKVDQIKQTLENVSQMLRQWFHIEFIYVCGPLVIHSSVSRHVLRDKHFLKSAIQSFLEKIVEVCEINTDVPDTVNVDFRVLEMTPHTETVKSEVKRFTQLPMYSERESTTDEDTVSCKHCHNQFTCDQCSIRRRQIEFLVTDNRRKIQTIIDMDMEFLKAEPKSEESNDQEWSQLTKTTETLELGEPPSKMPRLPGHGEDAETTTSTQPEAEYINWLKKNIEIYKGRVVSLDKSLVKCRRSKASINTKHRQLKQSSKELPMDDPLKLVRVQQRFKRQKSDFDTSTKQLRCYQTALHGQGQSTKIGEWFDKGPDTTDTEYSDDIMCQLCVSDQRPALCWCTECVQAMCRECTTVHRTQPTSSTHTPVLIIHDYNFQIEGTNIWDIASLCEEILIINDRHGKQLIICDIRGHNKQYIPLSYKPYRLSVIDQNNVAVTTDVDEKVLIVDVKQKTVTIEIDIKKGCYGITYRDNHLYVGCFDDSLVKVDMSGEIIRKLPLSFKPKFICSGTEGRIYCTAFNSNAVYCIATEGNTVFTVTNPDMSDPCSITTDNEGRVLVACYESNNVHRISPDDKQCNVIIKYKPPYLSYYPKICFDSISKTIVIGHNDTVYVYKE